MDKVQDNNEFMLFDLQYQKGINSANHLVSIMNIRNQLYSSLSQLTRRSFLMQTELPTLLTFKCVRDWLWTSIQWKLHWQQTKINTSRIIHDRQRRNCVTTVTIAIWQSSKEKSRCAILKAEFTQLCVLLIPKTQIFSSSYNISPCHQPYGCHI